MPEDLEAAEKAQGVRVEPGDILLVRTGYYGRRRAEGARNPGKDGSPAVHVASLPWIRERSVAMLGTDTHNDVSPLPYPRIGNALHVVGLVAMGMWLIDNGNLEELAQACARYRRWEFMLTLAPLVPRARHGLADQPDRALLATMAGTIFALARGGGRHGQAQEGAHQQAAPGTGLAKDGVGPAHEGEGCHRSTL